MAHLELAGVSKSYGSYDAIRNVSLGIEEGEFAVFVGPSGCGKSTLLRLIAGLDPISDGAIHIAQQDVTRKPAGTRSVAMVFQSYALYPHMTIFENIAFPLQMEKMRKDDILKRVEKAARTVQLSSRLHDKPTKLSGGQRQRVAIARAIVRKPQIFLMDEPLSNLDAALRIEMRTELIQLHRDLGATMVYVTHDQLEAMTMADRIVVLNGGQVEQVGTPMDLYHHPANMFVAGFIGSPPMNMLAGHALGGGRMEVRGIGQIEVPGLARVPASGAAVTIGIRPEFLSPTGTDTPFARVRPVNVERLGGQTIIHSVVDGQRLTCVFAGDHPVRAGDDLTLGCSAKDIHVFDDQGLTMKTA